MSELLKLQQAMQAYILSDGQEIPDNLLNRSNSRLIIYHDMYRLRLQEVLRNDYPATVAFIGNDEFDIVAKDYIKDHQSTHYSLNDYSQHFQQYLASKYPALFVVQELSRFEWQLNQVVNVTHSQGLALDDLQQVEEGDWAILCFELQPSVRLMAFNYNVVDIWQQYEQGGALSDVAVVPEKNTWLLWRRDADFMYYALDETKQIIIQGFQQHLTFADICQSLSNSMDGGQAAEYIGHSLGQWVRDGLFANCGV